ncbi:CBS domain-containing protein [Paenibacillus sp. SYP-B4298]|uniref:CBS domain-containing protein n=1 Tax=Paenibacillus sp. SYP-B4298 TaxID=2996034 RepID=UPI0022DD808E|nr:CBS domain-containing protein [Paenibacillus sp. SYP-B4298]
MKTVKEIMTTDCITATPQDNLYELAVMMKNNDIGFVPIVEGKKLMGVVTDRDLVIRGLAEKHAGSTEVAKVISSEVQTIAPEASVDEASEVMARHQIRRLPVVENGDLLGIVAIGDMAVRDIFADEAGEALSRISEQDQPSSYH